MARFSTVMTTQERVCLARRVFLNGMAMVGGRDHHALETDGASDHSSANTKDRDRLRQYILEVQG